MLSLASYISQILCVLIYKMGTFLAEMTLQSASCPYCCLKVSSCHTHGNWPLKLMPLLWWAIQNRCSSGAAATTYLTDICLREAVLMKVGYAHLYTHKGLDAGFRQEWTPSLWSSLICFSYWLHFGKVQTILGKVQGSLPRKLGAIVPIRLLLKVQFITTCECPLMKT